MVNIKNYEKIKNCLLNDMDKLAEIVWTINSYDNDLEDLDMFLNDEDFFKTFFSDNPYKMITKILYDIYDFEHKYVNFDDCGNLESYSSEEYEEILEDNIDRIIEVIVKNINEKELKDNELIQKISELIM